MSGGPSPREVDIVNAAAFMPGASAKFVKCAEQFDATSTSAVTVRVSRDHRIMGLMMLAPRPDGSITYRSLGSPSGAGDRSARALIAARPSGATRADIKKSLFLGLAAAAIAAAIARPSALPPGAPSKVFLGHGPNLADFHVADISSPAWGRKEIGMAEIEMPGLMSFGEEFRREQPLKGARISGSLHMTIPDRGAAKCS